MNFESNFPYLHKKNTNKYNTSELISNFNVLWMRSIYVAILNKYTTNKSILFQWISLSLCLLPFFCFSFVLLFAYWSTENSLKWPIHASAKQTQNKFCQFGLDRRNGKIRYVFASLDIWLDHRKIYFSDEIKWIYILASVGKQSNRKTNFRGVGGVGRKKEENHYVWVWKKTLCRSALFDD